MAAPQTSAAFFDLLEKSQLIVPDKLRAYRDQQTDIPQKPQPLANRLIDDGLITHLQASLLLKGKSRNFVVGGKYKLLEHIGTGGMGQVFLCEHLLLSRRVAIKVLPADKAAQKTSLKRFYREAQAVAALNHPHIVRAHDIEQDGALHFLVMEYVDGSDLQDIVKRRGPMPVGRAVEYIVQAACGLQHAHDAGLIHRDVKPSNLLLDRTGQVKLLDLGLARYFGENGEPLTRRDPGHNVVGTADYLAPEQALDSHAADARSDIYSLGATLYFLLAGHAPFKSGTIAQKLMQHQNEKPKPITEIRPDVPAGLADVLHRMLEKEPTDRYWDCLSLIDALNPFVPVEVPLPDASEMPVLCRAARSNDPPSGKYTAPERSGTRQRSVSNAPTPPRGQPTPPPSQRLAVTDKGRMLRRMALLALGCGGGGILFGLLAGKLLIRALTK